VVLRLEGYFQPLNSPSGQILRQGQIGVPLPIHCDQGVCLRVSRPFLWSIVTRREVRWSSEGGFQGKVRGTGGSRPVACAQCVGLIKYQFRRCSGRQRLLSLTYVSECQHGFYFHKAWPCVKGWLVLNATETGSTQSA